MTGPCFVDANVFVYARDTRDASKRGRALQWISHLWQERLGRTSIQVLSEYYAVATRKLNPRVPSDQAWDYVQELLAWAPQPVDAALLKRAHEIEQRWRLSWWDSMVVGAAQLQGLRAAPDRRSPRWRSVRRRDRAQPVHARSRGAAGRLRGHAHGAKPPSPARPA